MLKSRNSRWIRRRAREPSSRLICLDHFRPFCTTRMKVSPRHYGGTRSLMRIRHRAWRWSNSTNRSNAAAEADAACPSSEGLLGYRQDHGLLRAGGYSRTCERVLFRVAAFDGKGGGTSRVFFDSRARYPASEPPTPLLSFSISWRIRCHSDPGCASSPQASVSWDQTPMKSPGQLLSAEK